MKKLLLILSVCLLALPIGAKEISEFTKEEVIEIAKEACIKDGVSPDWFGGEVRVRSVPEKNRWYVSFAPKVGASDRVILGDHLSAYVYFDGAVECSNGI